MLIYRFCVAIKNQSRDIKFYHRVLILLYFVVLAIVFVKKLMKIKT